MLSRPLPDAEKWMARVLDLARRGEALASPNPLVGAILVRNGRKVGQGFHTYDGVRHAEIIALEAAGRAARGATLYINFEPCCHQGRTAPCTRALIEAGVKRVVAAMRDPNPAVAGKGFRQLRAAGIDVFPGIAESEAQRLNEAFAVWIRSRRPMVTLKSAMTLDSHMVLPHRNNGRSPWITSEAARAEVQRMRHASDAILTGIGTVLADDPLLTDRTGLPRRRPLLRVVLDSRLRLPLRSHLVRTAKNDVLVFTAASTSSVRARALIRAGVEVLTLRPAVRATKKHRHSELARRGGRSEESLRRLDLHPILAELARRQILSLMLEPGPTLHQAALDAGIVDKIRLFYAPILAGLSPAPSRGRARVAPPFRAASTVSHPQLRNLHALRIESFGPDFAVEAYLRDAYQS
jgi:diaminohydroxyphosphoribosylaminopyrimidine deaminase / 5-amino-6-(5-phosphoribosylamino)uracil reductase